MLGHSHAVSGALAFAAAAALFPGRLFQGDLSPGELSAGVALAAGAALLPDLDHHNGTIANFLGPVSRSLCRGVAKVSGGHRNATHSVAFAAFAGLVTWAGVTRLGRPFTLVMVFVLLALALRALHICPPRRGAAAWLTIVLLAGAGTAAVDREVSMAPGLLPTVVVIGCAAHLVGDCLTRRGAPLLWPLPMRFEVALIGRTGNRLETLVVVPVMALTTMALVWFAAFG